MSPSDLQGERLDFATRNHGLEPSVDFRDSIELDGWEQQSVWAWDDPTGTFYAELRRNQNHGDAADMLLSGVTHPMPSAASVVAEMVLRTKESPIVVMDALGLRDPDPILPSREAVTNRLHEELGRAGVDLADDDVRERFVHDFEARGLDLRTVGTLSCLLWLAGRQLSAPASNAYLPPIAAAVCAERLFAAGCVGAGGPRLAYFYWVYRTLHWDGVSE